MSNKQSFYYLGLPFLLDIISVKQLVSVIAVIEINSSPASSTAQSRSWEMAIKRPRPANIKREFDIVSGYLVVNLIQTGVIVICNCKGSEELIVDSERAEIDVDGALVVDRQVPDLEHLVIIRSLVNQNNATLRNIVGIKRLVDDEKLTEFLHRVKLAVKPSAVLNTGVLSGVNLHFVDVPDPVHQVVEGLFR